MIPDRRLRPFLTLLVAAALGSFGCGGPFLLFPGGALSGEVVEEPVESWEFVDTTFIDIETRPEDPYSVTLNYTQQDGQLYIDPAEGREWLNHIREDPALRVRVGDRLYPVRAVLVAEPGHTLEGFDTTRFIYRLESRTP
ncbi:MAG: hypothetical protein AAF430_20640 [Myxococcota bacterium]